MVELDITYASHEIIMKEWHGWRNYIKQGISLWFKGYLLDGSVESLHKEIIDYALKQSATLEQLAKVVNEKRGHFAFVVANRDWMFAATDKLRSIPLFYKINEDGAIISNHAPLLVDKAGFGTNDFDAQAILELSMSGYTIGNKTLCKDIRQITAGECLLVKKSSPSTKQYYNYSPWKVSERSEKNLRTELLDVIRVIFEDMTESGKGRQIVIPLSAGVDSRLVASALKELQVKDVVCFSYGRPNNFESQTAKQIAEKLGYKWFSVPLNLSAQKKSFASDDFLSYWDFSDTLANAPVLIDYTAIKYLKNNSLVAKDAVFINGNSGDFISGGHVNTYYNDLMIDSPEESTKKMIQSFINKHYSLWRCLKTEKNMEKIYKSLDSVFCDIKRQGGVSNEYNWAILESMECFGRQSKYVTATQRSYEYFQYDWRLPLWDPLFMEYWEGVPIKYKKSQNLYRSVLLESNWGGVWDSINVNEYKINSRPLKYCRGLSKALVGGFGRKAWKNYDRKIFSYFLDTTAATAITPYWRMISDTCGFRNRVSWISKKYLTSYGITNKLLK